MKFANHITNVYFYNMLWYILSMWVLEKEKSIDKVCDKKRHAFFNIDKDMHTSTNDNFWINDQNISHWNWKCPPPTNLAVFIIF